MILKIKAQYFLYTLVFTFTLSSSLALAQSQPNTTRNNVPNNTIKPILYKYKYTSLFILDPGINSDEKRNWYFIYRQAVDSCNSKFEYPDALNANIVQAKDAYFKECLYSNIIHFNNFENNLYFDGKKQEYNLYTKEPSTASLLEDLLFSDDYGLYVNPNTDITTVEIPLLGKKIKSFTLTPAQTNIFTHIFNIQNNGDRTIVTTKENLLLWVNKFNSATTRKVLKQYFDEFVNSIQFAPLENKEEIIAVGEKVYRQGKY